MNLGFIQFQPAETKNTCFSRPAKTWFQPGFYQWLKPGGFNLQILDITSKLMVLLY